MGRPATVIVLSEAEKAELIRRVKQRKGAQDACVRAQIILACAEENLKFHCPAPQRQQGRGLAVAHALFKMGIGWSER